MARPITERKETAMGITARLASINNERLADSDDWTSETESWDSVSITLGDGRVFETEVQSCEETGPYDAAVRAVIGDRPFEWLD
jgi:hypothetical protein